MDPTTVLKTLWHHKWVVLPILLLTAIGSIYVYNSERSFVSSASYALVTPQLPTARQIELDPDLEKVNRNNPYLRSSDVLLSQVLIGKMGTKRVAEGLESQGLSGEYSISPGPSGSSFGQILQLEASGATGEEAMATVAELGKILEGQLYDVQKVYGADDSSLIVAIPITAPETAEEAFSSRMRSMIIVAVAGVIVLFASVSAARAIELARKRRSRRPAEASEGPAPDSEEPGATEGTRPDVVSKDRLSVPDQIARTDDVHEEAEGIAPTATQLRRPSPSSGGQDRIPAGRN